MTIAQLGTLLIFSTLSSWSIANTYLGKGTIQAVYKDKCANCHGKTMAGGMAGSLLDETWKNGASDAQIATSIAKGVPGTSMPAWEKTLSAQEIRALVVLIREQKHLSQPVKKTGANANGVFSSKHHTFKMRDVGEGTNRLWAIEQLANGDLLATQRSGILWRFHQGKRTAVSGIPEVWHHDQGGLLDVISVPDGEKAPWIYLSFSETAKHKKQTGKPLGSTTVVRGKIVDNTWTQNERIFSVPDEIRQNRGWHFGSRFAHKGDMLFFSVGDEGYAETAQDISTVNGKIHRIHLDGSIPKDNPYVTTANAYPSIWTYGNRNAQGLDIHPTTGELWESEHGPRGGDEINIIRKGQNYGWPTITHGINYNGTPLTDKTSAPGMVQPIHFWVPSIATCGIEFYEGEAFPKWRNNLFVGGLGARELHRLEIKDNQVIDDEILLKGHGRVRDIANGPNGSVYVILNSDRYRIVEISPAQ